ncbi:chemotaxis protein CheW [Pokkaliibacter sp. CJK22405]|uniref:chemotaxis protein CheW n=1 Tax=Pokkaliibacter sp. CJK22405 TaxID=3384615 RepID=UPI003984C96F
MASLNTMTPAANAHPAQVMASLPEDDLATGSQYVTFMIGEDAFAVDMAPVQEIIRVPNVVKVPLAPGSLHGMANLRGQVLPIISLRRIFAFAPQAEDDATRAIVIDVGQPLGFVVDRVASVVTVEDSQIEGVEGLKSTINTEMLTGVLKNVAGHAMVMVLDFDRIVGQEFEQVQALSQHALLANSIVTAEDEAADEPSDELQLVSFCVHGQEYAIDIAHVQEIVQVPETITHIPNVPSHVRGMMTLRERLLPLVMLRSLFGLPASELDERNRVVVIGLGRHAIGLITDSVAEVLRVPLTDIDTMPGLLSRHQELDDIEQICRLDEGRRLVSILSPQNMFNHPGVQDALNSMTDLTSHASPTVTAMTDDALTEHDDSPLDDEEQIVVFRLADGEFGVPIASVQEIVRVPEELTFVPRAPACVEGVINLRGVVLPVLDQRKRMGLDPMERNDRQRIMVFLINDIRTGFIVDAVTEVLKLPSSAIERSPHLSDMQAQLLGRVANLEARGRMIQLIDPLFLIDEADQRRLGTVCQGE